jgi:hypothetical protein
MAHTDKVPQQRNSTTARFAASVLIGTFLTVACITTNNTWAQGEGSPPAGTDAGQRGALVSWISVPGKDGLSYMAQQSSDGKLILTADESFFPKLGLAGVGTGNQKDVDGLNKGESFASIGKWDSGDIAEWGLFLKQTGEVQLRVFCNSPSGAGNFELRIGDSSADVTARKTPKTQVLTSRLKIKKQGLQTLRLTCQQASPDCTVHAIEVSGPAATSGAVLRKRWRPAAAHTKFTSSNSHGPIRLWVMEMDAMPGELPFYSPITTPFGYYGPTWQANGKVNSSFNFSLWSFGRGKKAPPIEQLSHLLAAGDPKASLSGFSHEGTGVKIRNWDPLTGRQGQRQALALRVKPGTPYDTYYSYFYASDEKRWRLFGIGNRYNDGKPLKSLWVGSFVEVPGRAAVQRTGAYPRTMRYRGWCMDTSGKWHPLNRMATGNINKENGLTHTDRGVTDDGWFFLQTGGWAFRKPPETPAIQLAQQNTRPSYLTEQDIKDLNSTPSAIEFSEAPQPAKQRTISFNVRNAGTTPIATLFYGNEEALTFADQWQHQRQLPEIKNGQNYLTLPTTNTQGNLLLRLQLTNDEGIFWSGKTLQINQ